MFMMESIDIFEEERELFSIIMEAGNNKEAVEYMKTNLLDPIITVLESPSKKKEYIKCGSDFLDANAEMLSKEFPTKRVTYPRKYVDRVVEMFGFTNESLKKVIKDMSKYVNAKADFKTIMATPTNIIHTAVLYYSDMILHRQLRDSARQQLGLTMYERIFNRYFPYAEPNVAVMTYTYMQLDHTWNLVKCENVMNWIGDTVETCFQFFRPKLNIEMAPNTIIEFLNRVRTSFNQNMKLLARKYHENLENGNKVGEDLKGDEEYVETKSTANIRNTLLRMIRQGDRDYKNNGRLYKATAQLKNVKQDELYELAQKIEKDDISNIIDLILYVFITKEHHEIKDINSSVYIDRITKFPTAIDRAIPGKPVIAPFTKKYKCQEEYTRAYICLLATFILIRINRVKD
jgi:hypothetical protein